MSLQMPPKPVLGKCGRYLEAVLRLVPDIACLSLVIDDGGYLRTAALDDPQIRFDLGEARGYLRAVADLTDLSVIELVDTLDFPADAREHAAVLTSIAEWKEGRDAAEAEHKAWLERTKRTS